MKKEGVEIKIYGKGFIMKGKNKDIQSILRAIPSDSSHSDSIFLENGIIPYGENSEFWDELGIEEIFPENL